MIRHQTIAEHRHVDLNAGVGDPLEKRSEVVVLAKDLGAIVAPIDDMVTNPTDRSSRSTWHEISIPRHQANVNRNDE
jgi:hypothetical protein